MTHTNESPGFPGWFTVNLLGPSGLTPAGQVTYLANCSVSASASGVLSNTASVVTNALNIDPVVTNNSMTDTTTIVPVDLRLAISNSAQFIQAGGVSTYRIRATNQSSISVNNASVVAVFPSTLNCTWVCSAVEGEGPNGTTAGCPASGVGPIINSNINLPGWGSAVEFVATCAVSPTATGDIIVSGQVNTPVGMPDEFPSDNQASDSDPVVDTADIGIEFVQTLGTVSPNALVELDLRLSNNGPNPSTVTPVLAVFPTCLTQSAACNGVDGGTCGPSVSDDGLRNNNQLPAGGGVIFTIRCQLRSEPINQVQFTAWIGASSLPDVNPYNDDSMAIRNVVNAVLFKDSFE